MGTRVCIIQKGDKELRRSGGKEHDISGVGNERYDTLCAGCEGSEMNGTRPLRSPCYTVQN